MIFDTNDLILNTKDYSFTHFEHEGFGGSTKYIAVSKNNSIPQKLIVKHNCEFAAASNGFVFGRVGELLGIKMPKTYMFEIDPNDKHLFESPCVMGMEFIDGLQTFELSTVANDPRLFQAYIEYHVLYALLTEFEDKTQMAYVPGDTIYPFDFDESFSFEKGSFNTLLRNDYYSEYEISRMLKNVKRNGALRKLRVCYSVLCNQFGYDESKTDLPYFFELLERFYKLTEQEICSITNALLELFPELIGIYYEEYLSIMQQSSAEYLKQRTPHTTH